MTNTKPHLLERISLYIFYGLLAYMPLHVFLSTIVGVNSDQLELAKIFKDVLLMFGFCLLFVSSVNKPWFRNFISSKLTLLIAAYAVLTAGLALLKPTDQDAEILGVVYNLRFLLFFLYGWLLCYTFPTDILRRTSLKIVLGVGALVVGFGIVQYLFLPNDALAHLGFTRSNGVLPAFFIDDKPNLERVMSTLRDPNSLGSYLIIIISLIGALYLRIKDRAKKNILVFYGFSSLLCMYFTFSRSAWIGLLVSSVTFMALLVMTKSLAAKKIVKPIIIVTGILLVVLTGLFFTVRHTYFVQNVIFHADRSTVQEDPNQLRVKFIQESLEGIKNNPIGRGPGIAGLASIKNQAQGVQLNENYYLQIATEVGVVGFILFAIVVGSVAYVLYIKNRSNLIAIGLLASFAGLVFTNLLVHIWSNEAVAHTWWGLAGLYMIEKIRFRTDS